MLRIVYDSCLKIPDIEVNSHGCSGEILEEIIRNHLIDIHPSLESLDVYLLQNGRTFGHEISSNSKIEVIPRLRGGKGGFGSMLRAIGAQIEKTTNREACRDLSGRRLRDINEEKRLKKWIAEQAEREKEAAERKKRKLEKLCAEPKHDFVDVEYDKIRSEMTEKVHDAVEQGLKATSSASEPSTSKPAAKSTTSKKPKAALWMDDLEDLDSCDSESDEEVPVKRIKAN